MVSCICSYDGLAVKWGLGNTVKNAQECAEQCLNHMPNIIKGKQVWLQAGTTGAAELPLHAAWM